MPTYTNSTPVSWGTSGTYVTSQTVVVSGFTGPLATVSVTLNGLSHNLARDLDFLLVAPDGTTNLVFWSDVGSNGPLPSGNYTVSDAGSSVLPNTSFSAGTYQPANRPGSFGEAVETGAEFNR